MKELITALVKAKREFAPIVKDKNNPFFKSKYADLAGILESIDDALLNNGLFVSQTVGLVEGKTCLVTRIFHESGQELETIDGYPLPEQSDPQKFGSAVTYARRYQLLALFNLAAEDDDGNAASQPDTRSQKSSSQPAKSRPSKPAKNEDTSNPFPAQAVEIIKYARENGVSTKQVKDRCKTENLPDSSDGYKTATQITTLAVVVEEMVTAQSEGEAA